MIKEEGLRSKPAQTHYQVDYQVYYLVNFKRDPRGGGQSSSDEIIIP